MPLTYAILSLDSSACTRGKMIEIPITVPVIARLTGQLLLFLVATAMFAGAIFVAFWVHLFLGPLLWFPAAGLTVLDLMWIFELRRRREAPTKRSFGKGPARAIRPAIVTARLTGQLLLFLLALAMFVVGAFASIAANISGMVMAWIIAVGLTVVPLMWILDLRQRSGDLRNARLSPNRV